MSVDTSVDSSVVSVSAFAHLGLSPRVLQAVESAGYAEPSPIQSASIPALLEGRDLLGQAQTGTGKTAAFALPLLSRIDTARHAPQLLVLTPTRELALQVTEAMDRYARHLPGFRSLAIYGGQGMREQLIGLKRGVQLIVGTPGRVMDHLRRGTLDLSALRAVVLDEADEMLRMGFIEDVQWILDQTPATRQVALFSATMPPAIQSIARNYLKNPAEVRIAARTATVETIRQRMLPVNFRDKTEALARILAAEPVDAAIVFVRTKIDTVRVAEELEQRGVKSAPLNGDLAQAQREQTVDRLKRGLLDVVIATDVAARGLDVERISHVINYDIPFDTEAYVHRIGRTGRAGRAGDAILFVTGRERNMLRNIERATNQPIERMALPTDAELAARRMARLHEQMTRVRVEGDLSAGRALVEAYRAAHGVSIEDVAATLARMVLGEDAVAVPAAPDRAPEFDAMAGGRGERPRAPRHERPSRDERAEPREFNERRPRADRNGPPQAGSERYRIEVGRAHGLEVRQVVGAIANEAGVDGRDIGPIRLFDEHTLVDLPEGMPRDIFRHLKTVWVCGRQLRISRLDEGAAKASRRRAA